jgi:two-component system, response regulator YesN
MVKLMITEDELLVREGLKQYFNWAELGVSRIFEAENGKQGKEIALLEKPDLVLTDIRMPEMDGLEMIKQLRSELPNTMFIILTGFSEFSYAKTAIHLGGVHDYLLKPLQYKESLATISTCIENIKQRKQLQPTVSSLNDLNQLEEPQDSEGPPLFQRIESFIKENIQHDLSLHMVAEHFFYNPSYLSRLFKTKLNKNYMMFVSEIRVKYAQDCLKQPHLSIADVSKMCGYQSYKHFVKVFKSISRMTPTEYRKKLRV